MAERSAADEQADKLDAMMELTLQHLADRAAAGQVTPFLRLAEGSLLWLSQLDLPASRCLRQFPAC